MWRDRDESEQHDERNGERAGPGTTTRPQLEGRRKPVEQERTGQMTLSTLRIPTPTERCLVAA